MAFPLHLHALLLAIIFLAGQCICAHARNINSTRERRSSTLVGDACEGMYADATHCWPFNEARNRRSPDVRGDKPAVLKQRAKIVESASRGKVVSSLQPYSWIHLGKYKGRCIGEPRFCTTGISMIFWVKFSISLNYSSPDQKKYVFSSGGSDYRSQGFSLYKEYSEFVLKVASNTQVWKAFIPSEEMPLESWFSFAFTWSKDAGLRYFINGEESGSATTPTPFSHKSRFNAFRIGKASSVRKSKSETIPMKFDQLATWNRILDSQEIQMAFDQGGGTMQENACEPNPCLNGGTCLEDPGSAEEFRCKCPPNFTGINCEVDMPTPQPVCKPNPCLHGGTCLERAYEPEGYFCECPPHYFGLKCENEVTKTVLPTKPVIPLPDIKQFRHHLLAEINLFRRLHQSSDVSTNDKLNKLADQWAHKIAAEGVAKIDPTSMYGQLVCTHHPGGDMAKTCTVKWYSAVRFYDWADPKLTIKVSPFTQMVWKNNALAGVGLARGNGSNNNTADNSYNYVVVFFDPGQNDESDIRENVLPAAGLSESTPEALCPDGYFRLLVGSQSCFSVHNTLLTWTDAVSACARDGGTLASLQTREEADLVVNLLTKHNIVEAWIGLHDHSSEGRYIWVDGSTIPFSEWLPGEPDGKEVENCIVQARGHHSPGWGDRHCFDINAFVCEVPIPGFTTYKLTFHITEELTNYQNEMYTASAFPEYYSVCTPCVQNVNDLLRERITHFFEGRNILVMPIVNTIKCMPNGKSNVEVILRLGPGVGSESIHALRSKLKENDGELELSNGASVRLTAIEIVRPGVSYCPSHCTGSACQAGCDSHCCTHTATYYPPPSASAYHPLPIYTAKDPFQCPVSCTRSVSDCPPYCPLRCCRRRSQVKTH